MEFAKLGKKLPRATLPREIVRRLNGKRYADTMATFQEIIKRAENVDLMNCFRIEFGRTRLMG